VAEGDHAIEPLVRQAVEISGIDGRPLIALFPPLVRGNAAVSAQGDRVHAT
jgi:hypothetical protein